MTIQGITRESKKRPRPTEEGFPDSKRPCIVGIKPGVFNDILRVRVLNKPTDYLENVVWLNPERFKQLFPANPAYGPPHIQIAHKAYKVQIQNWLRFDTIGLSYFHYEEVDNASALFSYKRGEGVHISTFDVGNVVHKLSLVRFECLRSAFQMENLQCRTFDLCELRKMCSQRLQGTIIAPRQSFAISMNDITLDITVQAMKSLNENLVEFENKIQFGMITPKTSIHFDALYFDHAKIVRPEKVDKLSKFIFNIDLSESCTIRRAYSNPIVLVLEEIEAKVCAVLSKRSLAIDEVFEISYSSILIDLRLVGIKHAVLDPMDEESAAKLYSPSYVYNENPLKFRVSKQFILTKNEIFSAIGAEIDVINVARANLPEIIKNFKCLNLVELMQELKKIQKPYFLESEFNLYLAKEAVKVKLINAQPENSTLGMAKNWSRQWTLAPDVKVNFNISPSLQWKIVDHLETEDLSSVSLKGFFDKYVSKKQLKSAFRAEVTNGVFLDQVVEVNLIGKTYRLKVSSCKYKKKNLDGVEYGLIGKVLPGTKINMHEVSIQNPFVGKKDIGIDLAVFPVEMSEIHDSMYS